MRNPTSANILASFAYLGKDQQFSDLFFSAHQRGEINAMVDCGAFTLKNAKGNYSHINLKEYCSFLEEHKENCEKYVMLDIVGDAEKSRENYEKMLSVGLNPMYVCTMYDEDYDYIRSAVQNNPNICVAGGVTTKGDWMTKRFQCINRETNGKAKIHGLGYVTYPKIFQLPLTSIDSSTWVNGQKWGWISYFDKGIKFVRLPQLASREKTVPIELQKRLLQRGITAKMVASKELNRGSKSIGVFMGYLAWIEYQEFAARHDRNLFLAVANKNKLKMYLQILKHKQTITYEQFREM